MRKIINSATTQYEPLLTEELVLDDRPISGSFNGITSDAVYKAISVDPGNVPPVESTDNGKVLTASYGEGGGSFEWAEAQGGASYTAGNGIDITSDTISADLDPKGLKITSGKIDINLATNSGLGYAQSVSSETLTVGGSAAYVGSIRLNNSALSTYLDSASNGDTFTLTIPRMLFTLDDELLSGERVYFAFSNKLATQNPSFSECSYIDVTDQLSIVIDDMSTEIGNSTITLPAYMYASAGWSSDVASHTFGFFVTSEGKFFSGSGYVTASYTSAPSGLKVSNPLPASLGTAGQVLTVNAGATGVEWATPSGGGGSDVEVLTYGASVSYSDIVYAITQENTRFAVQGTVTIDGYSYTVYSDEMSYFGAGQSVSWLVTITGQAYTYQIKLLGNSNWYVDKYAELPSTSGASAGQVLSLNNYSQPVWTTPAASGGMKWSRNTHPTVDASNGITATLSGLSVTNSACVVNVSLLIYPSDMFATNIPDTLTFKVLQNREYSDYYFGTLKAELSSYQYESRYRACGTVTLPYGSSELSEIVIYDPNGTSLVVSGADYEVSVGVAK